MSLRSLNNNKRSLFDAFDGEAPSGRLLDEGKAGKSSWQTYEVPDKQDERRTKIPRELRDFNSRGMKEAINPSRRKSLHQRLADRASSQSSSRAASPQASATKSTEEASDEEMDDDFDQENGDDELGFLPDDAAVVRDDDEFLPNRHGFFPGDDDALLADDTGLPSDEEQEDDQNVKSNLDTEIYSAIKLKLRLKESEPVITQASIEEKAALKLPSLLSDDDERIKHEDFILSLYGQDVGEEILQALEDTPGWAVKVVLLRLEDCLDVWQGKNAKTALREEFTFPPSLGELDVRLSQDSQLTTFLEELDWHIDHREGLESEDAIFMLSEFVYFLHQGDEHWITAAQDLLQALQGDPGLMLRLNAFLPKAFHITYLDDQALQVEITGPDVHEIFELVKNDSMKYDVHRGWFLGDDENAEMEEDAEAAEVAAAEEALDDQEAASKRRPSSKGTLFPRKGLRGSYASVILLHERFRLHDEDRYEVFNHVILPEARKIKPNAQLSYRAFRDAYQQRQKREVWKPWCDADGPDAATKAARDDLREEVMGWLREGMTELGLSLENIER